MGESDYMSKAGEVVGSTRYFLGWREPGNESGQRVELVRAPHGWAPEPHLLRTAERVTIPAGWIVEVTIGSAEGDL